MKKINMKILKLAILFTFGHSFVSIMVLYVYTNWILQNNESTKPSGIVLENSNQYSMVSQRVADNALVNDVIRDDTMNIRGWWMSHYKWTENIECFNEEWGTCLKTFTAICRVDSIRSIYQWLPLKKESKVSGFTFTLRSTGEDLRREAPDAWIGAKASVKLSDGSSDTLSINLPDDSHLLLYKETSYSAPTGSLVKSVTIMVGCYGFVGSFQFTDAFLTLKHGFEKKVLQSSLISDCPEIIQSKRQMEHYVKLETFNVSKPSLPNYLHQVTLVTQLSMDRLGVLEKSLATWDGPVSLVVYIPFEPSTQDHEWQRLYIQKKLHRLSEKVTLHVVLAFGAVATDDYPVNYLRNIAIKTAPTPYLFLVDADFYPAPDFQQKFDIVIRADWQVADSTAWVVPAFEYLESPNFDEFPPRTKEDLVEQILADNSNMQQFRLLESPESHRLTDYWQWYRAEYPYQILEYNDKYEPYIVLKKTPDMPLYSELFTGYGMNKVAHITEVFAKRYRFKVLHDLWVIHIPHRTTKYSMAFLQNPEKRLKNRATRFEFLSDLIMRNGIGPCKPNR